MKAAITCNNLKDTDFIYDLLVTAASGCSVLSGTKICIDDHIMVDDIIEFNLTRREIEVLSTYSEVISININDSEIELHYNKIGQQGIPRLASYNTTLPQDVDFNQQISHSLLYCQTSELQYTHSTLVNGQLCSLSSIDCSNIDIIVLDTGIDKTHPDLFDQNNIQQTVEFNWTLLKEGDPQSGAQIVSNQSTFYYNDTAGHGTSCADLVAGKRNGFAKNAKIYSLRSNELGSTSHGFDITTCLRLALSFQKAKKRNLYNLDSTRPTIFTNSWGASGPRIADDLDATDINNLKFYSCFGGGKNTLSYNTIPGYNTVLDAYFRQILLEGVHVLVSAGNLNAYLTNNSNDFIDTHNFRRTESNSTYDYITIKTNVNKSKYTTNVDYGSGYIYGSTQGTTTTRRYYQYQSPNIGLDQSKIDYPIITVGDVIPIGSGDTDSNTYWSAGTAKAAYELLSAISPQEDRIINNQNTAYSSLSGPFFVKSSYSSFGPAVDIYAPGNGVWAALSNQISTTQIPCITPKPNERYYFFNGTSSACPIVAGVLATILADNPSLTPLEAKNVLLSSGLKGGIMETKLTTSTLSSYGTSGYELSCYMGANRDAMLNDSNYRMQNGSVTYFRKGNMDDLLFCSRFFNSSNILCQAYPLREAILNVDSPSVNIGLTTLNKKESITNKVTHSL